MCKKYTSWNSIMYLKKKKKSQEQTIKKEKLQQYHNLRDKFNYLDYTALQKFWSINNMILKYRISFMILCIMMTFLLSYEILSLITVTIQ